MKIFYSNGNYDSGCTKPSVFLAGPTLRGEDQDKYPDWRINAVQHFNRAGFDGALYVPSPMRGDHAQQIDWEVFHLENATTILFWIPRRLDILPGFTTNIEFGEWMRSGKIVLGYPTDAKKMIYLIHRAKTYGIPLSNTLEGTVRNAIELTKEKLK